MIFKRYTEFLTSIAFQMIAIPIIMFIAFVYGFLLFRMPLFNNHINSDTYSSSEEMEDIEICLESDECGE